MKRLYMTLGLAGAFAINAQAQQYSIDIEVRNLQISATSFDCDPQSDSFTVEATLINNGPDDIILSNFDSGLGYFIYDSRTERTGSGNNARITGTGVVLDNDWMVGQDRVHTYKVHFSQVNELANPNGDIILRNALESGKDYGYIFAYSSIGWRDTVANLWIGADASIIEDSNPQNNRVMTNAIPYNCGVGIASVTNNLNLNVYPNPVEGMLNISNKFESSNVVVNISDVTGRTVLSRNFDNLTIGSENISVNVSELNSGTYFIELVTDNGRGVSKFTKK